MFRMKACLSIVALTVTTGIVQAQAPSGTMAAVSARIAEQRPQGAAKLPTSHKPPTGTPSPYYDELHFTIVALSTQSFADLFAPDATALSITSKWQENMNNDDSLLDTKFDNLKTEVGELIAVLDSNTTYRALTFAHMIDRRLLNKLVTDSMKPLELAIDDMVQVGFQFPLFRKPTGGVSHADIMTLLYSLCEKHFAPGVNDGGLGNMNWERLFYTPADPVDFTDAKLTRTVMAVSGAARMQGNVLPSPNEKYKVFVQEEFAKALAADQCCCNFQTAHPLHYRKCASLLGSQCSICGGTYCCLAGVQWCPSPASSHPYP